MRRAPRPVGRQDGKRAEICCRDTETQACKAESREASRIQAWLMTEATLGGMGGPVEGELALLRILVPGGKYSCGGDGRTSPSRGQAESTLTIRRERMSWTAFKSRPSPHQETPVRVRREMGCVCQFSFQIHQERLHFSEKGQTAISSGPSQKRLSTQPVGTGEGA